MNKKLKGFIETSWSALIIGLLAIIISMGTMGGINIYGIIIVVIGEVIYGYNNFKMGNIWTVTVESKPKLIKDGLFKYIRHPLYLGALIAAYGLSITFMSWISILFNTIILVSPVAVNFKLGIIIFDILFPVYRQNFHIFFNHIFNGSGFRTGIGYSG